MGGSTLDYKGEVVGGTMSWRAPWNSKDKAGGTGLVSKKEEEGAWGVHRPQCKKRA